MESYIKHCDCLDGMRELPDNSIDLICTDPPYLMSYKTNRRIDKSHPFCKTIQGDNDGGLIIASIKEFYRILKDNAAIYIFCNSNKIEIFKHEIEEYFNLKNIIIWVKNNWTAGDLEAQYGKQYEFIIYANKGRRNINGKRLTDVWRFDRKVGENQVHQNQKPIGLIQQIIGKSSSEGDIVCDAYMGSGTTAIACLEMNRRYIGFEIDKKYYDIAQQRIKEYKQQLKLF